MIIYISYTAQKMKISITDFCSKCDQVCRKLWICSHLMKKSVIENCIFCAILVKMLFQKAARSHQNIHNLEIMRDADIVSHTTHI